MEIDKQEPETATTSACSLALFVIGMAGSGKTTLTNNWHPEGTTVYRINLDPAVLSLKYIPLYDIREDFPFKKVMEDYKLGPNGAIMTALNLFSANVEKLLKLVKETMEKGPALYLIDVPGQIQAFTWSASSLILTAGISSLMKVGLIFVIDLFRCQNPNSFLSNVLFAQSIETRVDLPMVLALNKCDCVKEAKNLLWLKDYMEFDRVLDKDTRFLSSLSKTVVLYMSDFFQEMVGVPVSALMNTNLNELWKTCQQTIVTRGLSSVQLTTKQ